MKMLEPRLDEVKIARPDDFTCFEVMKEDGYLDVDTLKPILEDSIKREHAAGTLTSGREIDLSDELEDIFEDYDGFCYATNEVFSQVSGRGVWYEGMSFKSSVHVDVDDTGADATLIVTSYQPSGGYNGDGALYVIDGKLYPVSDYIYDGATPSDADDALFFVDEDFDDVDIHNDQIIEILNMRAKTWIDSFADITGQNLSATILKMRVEFDN